MFALLEQIKVYKNAILCVAGSVLIICLIVLWNLNSAKSKAIDALQDQVDQKQLLIDTLKNSLEQKAAQLTALNAKYQDIEKQYGERVADLMSQLTSYETDVNVITQKVNETINSNLLLLSKATGWEDGNEK